VASSITSVDRSPADPVPLTVIDPCVPGAYEPGIVAVVPPVTVIVAAAAGPDYSSATAHRSLESAVVGMVAW
jgi:hypothetical protein